MSELIAWWLGLVMGAGLVAIAWGLSVVRALRLDELRRANERALLARADGSWYIAGQARLSAFRPPHRPRLIEREEPGR